MVKVSWRVSVVAVVVVEFVCVQTRIPFVPCCVCLCSILGSKPRTTNRLFIYNQRYTRMPISANNTLVTTKFACSEQNVRLGYSNVQRRYKKHDWIIKSSWLFARLFLSGADKYSRFISFHVCKIQIFISIFLLFGTWKIQSIYCFIFDLDATNGRMLSWQQQK